MSQKSQNNRDTLDAWVIFEHLYGAQRKDLIDYLIHQLYYLSDDDIDFFIPQLCTLLISPSEEISKQLECFILHKCMKSIDFAIKCFWNLHAIQFYSKLEQHKNRCDEMRQNLEMIVVNGQLPRNLFTQLPNDIQKELINDQQKEEKDIEQQQQNGHNNNNNNNNSNNNNKLLNGNKPPLLSSALPQPKKPNNIKKVNDPLLNGATEYLKKQRRCTYFNAELDFAHFLEGVSSALEQCDREDRPRLLEDNIRYANKCLPRGLYIPIAHRASDKHKSLLRIVPNEGKCLDSKQKVPFLLFCETEQHSYPTSSPLICEELTESETALLSSSGLYVLIDEHRKRHNKNRERDKLSKHKRTKKDNPKRLKPTQRRPSKVLSKPKVKAKAKAKKKHNHMNHNYNYNKSKSPKSPKLVVNMKMNHNNIKSISDPTYDISTPTPPISRDSQRENTISQTIDDEYSISSKNISQYSDDDDDDDDDEQKRNAILSNGSSDDTNSNSNSNSNDQLSMNVGSIGNSEPSKSVTNTATLTNPNNKRVNLSSIPTPQPKPIDRVAEEAMKRHLEALKPFEPSDHKAIKKNKNNIIALTHSKSKDDDILLTTAHKNKNKSQSMNQLLSPHNKSSVLRSRTPEPNKLSSRSRFFTRKNQNNNKKNNYYSKSDGSDTNCTNTNKNKNKLNQNYNNYNNNNNNSPQPQSQPQIIVNQNSKVGVVQSIKYDMGNNNNKNKKEQLNKPSVVIYRHPNYLNSKQSKLQYLRGKSMQWHDPFGEQWDKRRERYKQTSPFKYNMKWSMQSVIFKSGEDMRQEQMAMQFIKLFDCIWRNAKLPLQLRPYSVIVTSPASGFVETVPNSVSISRLKHAITNFVSLRKFFEQFYGPCGSPGFQQAQKNFVESMAGYSLVAYFLQIKDRHNGNILLTSEGSVVHIDFDFLFSNSPGGNIGFESAPFKLTEEFIQVMGGEQNSEMFDYFKILLIRGFLEARKHVRKFVLISRIMLSGAPMPCFLAGESVINQLKERFAIKLKNEKCVEFVYNLIEESSCNWRSVQYDKFQRITNNIL